MDHFGHVFLNPQFSFVVLFCQGLPCCDLARLQAHLLLPRDGFLQGQLGPSFHRAFPEVGGEGAQIRDQTAAHDDIASERGVGAETRVEFMVADQVKFTWRNFRYLY